MSEADRRLMIYFRGAYPNVELVVAPGDHTYQAYPVTYRQLVRMMAFAADIVRKEHEQKQ